MQLSSDVEEKMRTALHNNLLLLGFDPEQQFEKFGVRVDKETFKVPNHKAFQIVGHFLLLLYDPSKEREMKNCWPIINKKDEREFRSVCYKCLRGIVDSDTDCNFPHFSPSLFLSPGGSRFCHLYLVFTSYIMQRILAKDYPDEIQLQKPKNEQEMEVMRLDSIVNIEKYKSHRKSIDDVTVASRSCFRDQCDRYWKTLGQIEAFETQLKEMVNEEMGAICAVEYYAKINEIERELLEFKTDVEDGWRKIKNHCTTIAKCNETVENVLRRPEDMLVLDGKDLVKELKGNVNLESHLASVLDTLTAIRKKFDEFAIRPHYLPKLNIEERRSVTELEEFLTDLKVQLNEVFDSQTQDVSGTDKTCALLPPTPCFEGLIFNLKDEKLPF